MKTRLFCFMALFALLSASCTKDATSDSAEGKYIRTLKATIEDMADTRAAVDLKAGASYGKVEWADGDRILVNNGSATETFVYNASRKCFVTESATFAATGTYTAVYPASICSGIDSERVSSVTVPSVQTYVKDGVVSAPMHATAEGGSPLNFKNICGILRFSFKGTQNLKSVGIISMGANVSGDAVISSNGTWTMGTSEEGKNVSMACGDVTLSDSESTVYMYLPAQVYEGGLELDVEFADGTHSLQSTSQDIVVTASRIDGMSLFTASSAKFSGGAGTEADPYLIATAADLASFSSLCASASAAQYLSAFYRQTRDIDASSLAGYVPAGSSEEDAFKGSYDGCGHKISGLKLTFTGENAKPCGMFGYTSGARIRNLELKDVSISSEGQYVGAVAGSASGTEFEKITVSGKISSTANISFDGYTCTLIGGVAGYGINSAFRSCTLDGQVHGVTAIGGAVGYSSGCTVENFLLTENAVSEGDSHFIGGVAGRARMNTVIRNSDIKGSVSSYNGNYLGGFVGQFTSGVIEKCTYHRCATISSHLNHVGGIAGTLQCTDSAASGEAFPGKIVDCVSEGPVVGCQNTAGIVGYFSAGAGHPASVENCVSRGDIVQNGYNSTANLPYYAGGIVGQISDSGGCSVISCASYGEVTTCGHTAGGIAGYIVSKVHTVIDSCIAYGDIKATYSSGGIVGYFKCNDAGCFIDISNSVYAGKTVTTTGNNGANGYSLAAGIAGWIQVTTGSAAITNCCSRVKEIYTYSKMDTYTTSQNTIGGVFGYVNGTPAAFDVYGGYSVIEKGGIHVDGTPLTEKAATSVYGGLYGKINASACETGTFRSFLYSPQIQVGPSPTKVKKLDTATVKAYTDSASLLSLLNSAVDAYTGSCVRPLKHWVADTDGWPVIEGMTAVLPASTTKRLSVIGDSISTFRGYVPEGYSCHYPTADGDLTSARQTYWYRLVHDLMKDATIDKNIAFSGTAVTRTTNSSYSSQGWYGKDYCARFIAQNGVGHPDIIIIHGGTNDYGHNVDPLAPGITMRSSSAPSDTVLEPLFAAADAAVTYEQAKALNDTTLCEAFMKLIRLCRTKYPGVKIILVIGDYLTAGIEQSILKIGAHYTDIKIVDLLAVNGFNDQTYMPKHDYNPSTGSGCHPSSKAMEFIANKIYAECGEWMEK